MIDQNVWTFIDFEIFQSTTKLARHSDMKQTNANSMRLSTLKNKVPHRQVYYGPKNTATSQCQSTIREHPTTTLYRWAFRCWGGPSSQTWCAFSVREERRSKGPKMSQVWYMSKISKEFPALWENNNKYIYTIIYYISASPQCGGLKAGTTTLSPWPNLYKFPFSKQDGRIWLLTSQPSAFFLGSHSESKASLPTWNPFPL